MLGHFKLFERLSCTVESISMNVSTKIQTNHHWHGKKSCTFCVQKFASINLMTKNLKTSANFRFSRPGYSCQKNISKDSKMCDIFRKCFSPFYGRLRELLFGDVFKNSWKLDCNVEFLFGILFCWFKKKNYE